MRRTTTTFMASALLAVVSVLTLIESPSAAAASEGECSSIVGVSVRGRYEHDGGAFAGPTVKALSKQLTERSVDHKNLDYNSDAYNQYNQAAAAADLTRYLENKTSQCRGTQFVLVGYSQGALIIGNVLASGDVNDLPIVGAAFYGDPRFNGDEEKIDEGTYNPDRPGGISRRPTGELHAYADRLRSYCRDDDHVCQDLPKDSVWHEHYEAYVPIAVDFLTERIRAAG